MADADDTEVLGEAGEPSEYDTGLLRIVIAHETPDLPGDSDASGSVSSESLRTAPVSIRESLAEPAWDEGPSGGRVGMPTGSAGGREKSPVRTARKGCGVGSDSERVSLL